VTQAGEAERLLLFDIDGTLMDTRGAGLSALLDGAVDCLSVTRDQLPELDLAGATDGSVVRHLFAAVGHPLTPEAVDAFHQAYLAHLKAGLQADGFCGHLLPAVEGLLHELSRLPHVTLGLLTGNIREGAMLKLRRFSIERYFLEGAFGDDAIHRDELGPIAITRLSSVTGKAFSASQTIIIGDTPKDIACAAACGARCLAVATGSFTEEQLLACEPWRVLRDFRDTAAVVKLLS
jgi:phosphoglycolate phosphatase